MKVLIAILIVISGLSSFAQSVDPRFLDVGREIEKHYGPIAKSEGQTLNIRWLPESPIFNSTGIYRDNQWEISVYGGLLKNPGLTAEAFRFILCHEMGHIIGGRPYYDDADNIIIGGLEKYGSSNSGQPDYYATAICMKVLLRDQDNSYFSAVNVDQGLNSKCVAQFKTVESQNLCRRIGNAGLEAMKLFESVFEMNQNLSFDTPSKVIARTMIPSHPELQCRLDTILAGALCLFRPSGASSHEAEQMNEACSRSPSDRPRCWFVP